MADYWIKLYHEILDDPKVATLSDRLWRRMVELFLVAGRLGGDEKTGELPPTKQIAWLLRTDETSLIDDINQLAEIGILEETGTGWLVINFQDRQGPVPDIERKRQERVRKHKAQYYGQDLSRTCHEGVTDCETETETESESDYYDDDEPKKSQNSNIFQLYEQNIGILTPIIAEKLKAAETDYPADWFPWAFGQAVSNNARSWAYVDACLRNRRDGKDHIPRVRSPAGQGKNGSPPQKSVAQELAEEFSHERFANDRHSNL